jgi:hypothetical protein
MTIKSKTRRSWRRAGRCLGLILGLLWLTGCVTAQGKMEAERLAREQSFQENMKALEAHRQERIKLQDECDRKLRIGMTAKQVMAIDACNSNRNGYGQLIGSETITAAGTFQQIDWGTGYVYFQNGVLVSIQR